MSDLVENPEDRFSQNEAHISPYANNKATEQLRIQKLWLNSSFYVRCLEFILPSVSTFEISRLKLALVAERADFCHTYPKICFLAMMLTFECRLSNRVGSHVN